MRASLRTARHVTSMRRRNRSGTSRARLPRCCRAAAPDSGQNHHQREAEEMAGAGAKRAAECDGKERRRKSGSRGLAAMHIPRHQTTPIRAATALRPRRRPRGKAPPRRADFATAARQRTLLQQCDGLERERGDGRITAHQPDDQERHRRRTGSRNHDSLDFRQQGQQRTDQAARHSHWTTSVPQGNESPRRVATACATSTRATLPSAPPSATSARVVSASPPSRPPIQALAANGIGPRVSRCTLCSASR